MPPTRRIPYWVFGLGLLLIGLAVLVTFSTGPDHVSPETARRARMIQAVSDLQACPTCHIPAAEELAANGGVVLAIAHADRSLAAAFSAASTAALKAEITHHLLNLGQRILAVPPSDSALAQAAADEFLHLYEQVQSGAVESSGARGVTWARLAVLAELVRLLENQAQPARWNQQPDRRPGQVELAPTRLVSVSPGVAAAAPTLELGLPSGHEMIGAVPVVGVVARMVFGVHRRGPPSAAYREWV